MEYVSSLYVYVCQNVNVLAIRFSTVVADKRNHAAVLASDPQLWLGSMAEVVEVLKLKY